MSKYKAGRTADGESESGSERFKHLPEPIRLEDTIANKDTRIARDPNGGRDTERDFEYRYYWGMG